MMTKLEITTLYIWREGMSEKEMKDGAYWERNMLALRYADGWYNDDVFDNGSLHGPVDIVPRFSGWRRVISCDKGAMCFHVPDDFDVGNLPEIERNWDGHSTEQKWKRIQYLRGIS